MFTSSHAPTVYSGDTAAPASSIVQMARLALASAGNREDAREALTLFRSYCDFPMPRVPGMDTWIRLAIRIGNGMSIKEAAAREYGYRWHLFLDAWINHTQSRSCSRFAHGPVIYPAPHLLGR